MPYTCGDKEANAQRLVLFPNGWKLFPADENILRHGEECAQRVAIFIQVFPKASPGPLRCFSNRLQKHLGAFPSRSWPVFRIRIRLIRIRTKISIRIRILDPDPGSRPCQIYRKNIFLFFIERKSLFLFVFVNLIMRQCYITTQSAKNFHSMW